MNETDAYRRRLYQSYVRPGQGLEDRAPEDNTEIRRPYLERLVRRHFPPDRAAAILELGCGYGPLIQIAREAGYTNMTGVDLSSIEVARAASLGIAGVRQGDLMAALAAQADASLDAVVAFDVIEHFRKDEILAFADQVRRTLRTGGRFIVHTCNAESPFGGLGRYGDFTHEVAFTRDSIRQVLNACGFRDVHCHEDRPVPHGATSAVRWLLWHVFRTGLRLWRAVETGDTGRWAIFSQDMLVVAVA